MSWTEQFYTRAYVMACRSFQLLKGCKLNVKYRLYIINIFVKTQCCIKLFMVALCHHELKFFHYIEIWDILIPYVNFIVSFLHFKRKCK